MSATIFWFGGLPAFEKEDGKMIGIVINGRFVGIVISIFFVYG